MSIELNCWGFIPSCTGSGELVQVTEEVYLIIKDGQFTDGDHPGFVSATVSDAYKQCDDCYNYIFEATSALPAGVASLAQCDILTVICDPSESGVPCCAEDVLTITSGNAPDDTSGGSATVAYGSTIHLWSNTLSISVGAGGVIQIEGVITSLGTGAVITGVDGGTIIPTI